MTDDRTQRGPQDAKRVNLSEDYEVAYWTNRFGITAAELRNAVGAVGNSAAAFAKHLKG